MDSLKNLPVDNNQLPQNERNSFGKIYPDVKLDDKAVMAIGSEIKDTLVAGVLFVILTLPITSKCVDKIMGENGTTIGKIASKTAVFMVLFYIIKNLPYMKTKQ